MTSWQEEVQPDVRAMQVAFYVRHSPDWEVLRALRQQCDDSLADGGLSELGQAAHELVVASVSGIRPMLEETPQLWLPAHLFAYGAARAAGAAEGLPRNQVLTLAYLLFNKGETAADEVRAIVTAVDPAATTRVQAVGDNVASSLEAATLGARIAGGFGLLALAIAAIGIAGVFSFVVTERTREIGIRLALGASRRRVRSPLFRRSSRPTAIGAVIGLSLVALAGPVLRGFLYGLSPTSPVVYLAVAPKSNAVYVVYGEARADVEEFGTLDVPLHLRNAPTKLMKSLGYGEGYRYAHDEPGAFAKGERYLPEDLPDRRYYRPVPRGLEIKIGEVLARLRGEASKEGDK
jgi:hypothetical protein